MKINIITVDDWEALYIDGKIKEQGHVLGEGNSRLFFMELSEELGFTSEEVYENYAVDEDEELVNRVGCFPDNMSDLVGEY